MRSFIEKIRLPARAERIRQPALAITLCADRRVHDRHCQRHYRVTSVGAEVELEIRQIVREDAIPLYGFATAAEKLPFDLAMSVPQVGAKPRAHCAVGTVPAMSIVGSCYKRHASVRDCAPEGLRTEPRPSSPLPSVAELAWGVLVFPSQNCAS
jgi:hypothetical protein